MKKRMFSKALSCFLAFLVFLTCVPGVPVFAAEGNTYYVATTGSDTDGDGSSAKPFATFEKAVGLLAAGDTLVVKEGKYTQGILLNGKKGSTAAPITIRGEGTVELEGSVYEGSAFGNYLALGVVYSEYITISNVSFKFKSDKTDHDRYAVGICGNKNLTIRNCSFDASQNGAYAAVHTGGTNDNLILDGNYFSGADNSFYGAPLKNAAVTNNIFKQYYTFHYESGVTSNTTISNNVFAGTGEHFYGGSYENSIITNNIFKGITKITLGAGNTCANNCITSSATKLSDADIVADSGIFASDSDYHLSNSSPCIDAGTSIGMPERDRDGKMRYGTPDIGAYNYGNVVCIDAAAPAGGNGQSMETAFNSFLAAKDSIVPGVTVLVKPGIYNGGIALNGTGVVDTKGITIQKLGEGTVTINGGANPAVELKNYANIKIQGFTMTSTSGSALSMDGAINCEVSGSVFTAAEYGVKVSGNSKGCSIFNNLFEQSMQKGILVENSEGSKIYSNVFNSNTGISNENGSFTNTSIMNNTFVTSGSAVSLTGNDTGNTVANNIFKASAAITTSGSAVKFLDAVSNNTVDFNLYDSSVFASKPDNEANSICGDPRFKGGSDYHLLFGSAAADKGTSANAPELDCDSHFRYGKTDIGAYEYIGTPMAFNIEGKTPTPQAIGVKINSTVDIVMSEKAVADNGNFTSNISVTALIDGEAQSVAGSFSAADEGSGTKVVFTPAEPLRYDTNYTVTVKKELQSINGNYLSADVKWSFDTEKFITDTYYIAQNGSDSNLGTIDNPKKTAASLVSKLKPGDTVYFRGGTYNGIIVMQLKEGTAEKPITFKSYQNERAVLTSDNPDYILYMGHCKYINIEGLVFAPNASQNGARGCALRIDNHTASYPQSTGIKVTGCRFENCGMCIAVRDLVDIKMGDLEISNNVIYANNDWGIYFQDVSMKAGSYGKIFNNVIYNATRSVDMFGNNAGLLFYNNTFASVYDVVGAGGQYDIYPVQSGTGAFVHDVVFKNNIFSKPIRTQVENGMTIVDASQNCVFDNNVYSIAGTQRVTYNGGGEGPVLTLTELQSGSAWEKQGRALETHGKSGKVTFVNTINDARIIETDNIAIGAAASEIVAGVNAPAVDIAGKTRTPGAIDAGAYSYDPTLAFVGNYSGSDATGSMTKPYASITAAIAKGAKDIQVIAGTYSGAQTINNGATISAYGGEVTFSGAVNISGAEGYSILAKGINFAGTVSVSGKNVSIDGCKITGELSLNGAVGAVITNNIFAPKATTAITLDHSTNCAVTNNVITKRQSAIKLANASLNNKIYNNTLYGNTKDVELSLDSVSNVFKNNIFSTKLESNADNTFDYNLFNTDAIDASDSGAAIGTNAVKASAGFINVKAGDYRLYKLSACIGKGAPGDVNTPSKDIAGTARKNPPDIGAYTAAPVKVEYYVDSKNGNDANSGIEAEPFKTIGEAVKALRNGETIIIKEGTYSENIVLTDRQGLNADDYVIKADGAVVLNGSISVTNSTGVTIEGLTVNAGAGSTAVTLANSAKANLRKLVITDTKTGISAVNCAGLTIYGVGIKNVETGIAIDGAGNRNNKASISQTRIDNASVNAITAANQLVLTLTSSIISNSVKGVVGTGEAGLLAINNTFYNNSGYSIDIKQADGHVAILDIYNNIFARNARGKGAFTRIEKGTGFYSEYNLYDAAEDEIITNMYGADQTFTQTVNGGDDTCSRAGDPMFRDAASGDFRLIKGSPSARNAVKSFKDLVWNPTTKKNEEKTFTAPTVDFAGTEYSKYGQDIGALYTPYSLKTIHLAGENAGWSDGTGAADCPVRTLGQAYDLMDSADTIIVHKGIYTGRYNLDNKHGVADANCIIKACTDPDCEICKINGTLPGPIFTGKKDFLNRDEESTHECLTLFTNCSYITVEGINVTGFRGAGLWAMNCTGLTFRDLNIWDIDTPTQINSGVEGLLISDTTNSLFKDINIWDIGQTRKSQADHGAYIGHCSNLVFDGLKVSNSPGGGIQFYAGDNYNIHSTNCTIKNSVFAEANFGLILVGIQGFKVINNTFYNNWGNDLYIDWNVRNNLFQNNIFYNDRSEVYDSVYGKVKPVIVGYQGSIMRKNADNTYTNMVVDNTFKNNMYQYKNFPANCQKIYDIIPIKEFMAAENAAPTNNKYIEMTTGNIKFKGSLAGSKDDYERAFRIFTDILDLEYKSDCIDKGLKEFAPTVDILGRDRVNNPDLGAYECYSTGPKPTPIPEEPDSNVTPAPTATPTPTPKASPVVEAKPELNKDGVAEVKLNAEDLNKAFSAATADSNGVKKAVVEVAEVKGAKEYVQQLPADMLAAGNDDRVIEIKTSIGSVAVPSNMLAASEVKDAQKVGLGIGIADKSAIDKDLKEKIGDRPVIELNLTVNGKVVSWNNPDAPVTVTLDYKPTAEELKDPEHIVVWYIDGSGKVISVPNGKYDPATGKITFTTTHFSKYAVSFVKKTFTDIGAYGWAKNQIEVLASKGIISGAAGTAFAPGENINRADFIILLVKGLGLTAKVDSNFADVSKNDYYYEAVGIARKLGIVSGAGGDKFMPKSSITRQDMMVMTDKALKAAGKLKAFTAADFSKYSDASKISSYAKSSIANLLNGGIISGSSAQINPQGFTTRAEAAVVVYKVYNK